MRMWFPTGFPSSSVLKLHAAGLLRSSPYDDARRRGGGGGGGDEEFVGRVGRSVGQKVTFNCILSFAPLRNA